MEGQVTFPFWCPTHWVTEGHVTSPLLLVPHPLDYGRTSYMATIMLQTDRLTNEATQWPLLLVFKYLLQDL